MDAATLAHVTDLGFLWFREFYLETSRVIQVRSKVSTVQQLSISSVAIHFFS